MVSRHIEDLIMKHLQGTASQEEVSQLQQWYQKTDLSQVEMQMLTKEEVEESGLRIRQHLLAYTGQRRSRFFLSSRAWWKAAAVFLLLLGGLWWWNSTLSSDEVRERMTAIANLPPGHTGAVLHLDDGSTILLDSTAHGLIASESGVEILRDSSGVQYKGTSHQLAYNTISTEKGRMWSLTLPDGTKVWLNAASSIRFPLNFNGAERIVELTGEAYFEVVHNARQPFRVKVADQVIEDLGTSFNINAYGDNQNIITTLVEGSLRIDSKEMKCVLMPGQQASIGKDNIICEVSQMGAVTSWKDGYFEFYDAGLKEMLQQISRWYNFDVTYKSGLTEEKFTGRFPKNLALGKALEILKQSGINFTLEPGKEANKTSIIISPI